MTIADNPVGLLMLESLCHELRRKLDSRPRVPTRSEVAIRQIRKMIGTTLQVLAVLASAYLTIVAM